MDLIFSSDENIIENISVGEPFGTSDHNVIEFELVVSKIITDNPVNGFNYHKANYKDIIASAITKKWENINSVSSDDIWLSIKSDMIQLRNEFVPKSNKRKKFKCKWVTKTVRKCRRAKIRAWNKYISSGKKLVLYNSYKKKLNKSVNANRNAKKQFETKLANNVKNDSKSFFAYVRSNERNKVKVGPLKDNLGNIITDNKVTADIFNDYFASVFTREDTNNIPVPDQIFVGSKSEYLSDISIDEHVVYIK